MNEDIVKYLLDVEHAAMVIYEDARRSAARMIAEAERAAAHHRQQTLSQAQAQALQIITTAQDVAETARERTLSAAAQQADSLEDHASARLDRAITTILADILPPV